MSEWETVQDSDGWEPVPEGEVEPQQSFTDKARALGKEAYDQTVGFIPSAIKGVNRSVGGVIQAGSEGLERAGAIPAGSTSKFSQYYNDNVMNVPFSEGEYRNPVGEFAGEVVPYLAAAPEALAGRIGLGAFSGATSYNESGDIDTSNRIQGGAIGAALGVVSKPISDAVVGTGRVVAGAAQSIYNKIFKNTDDAYAPLHDALTPAVQKLTGVGAIVNPTSKEAVDLAPQIKAKNDWVNEADAIESIIGKRPNILLSSELGSKRVGAAERVVLNSNAADKALNQLSAVQDDAVSGVTYIGNTLRKQPVSPTRAGAAVYNAHVKFETQLTRDLEEGAAQNYGRIKDQFGDFPMINYTSTKAAISREAEKQLDAGNDVAAASLAKMADRLSDEQKTIDAVLKYRKSRARNARGVGSIAGLGREDTAEVASRIVKSINDDILDAGARSGNPGMQAELALADRSYREGYDQLRKARESTLGKLVNVRAPSKGVESINKRARLSADAKVPMEDIADKLSKMTPSEFRLTMKSLNSVDPMIEKRVGRYLIDKAVNDSKKGGSRMETDATHDVTALYDSIQSSNVLSIIKNSGQRKEAESILKWIARSADRTGGGSPTDPLKSATKTLMATSTMSAPFLIQAAGAMGLAPVMERALFTETGRRAMKTIMKYPNVNPAFYMKAQDYIFRKDPQVEEPVEGVGPVSEIPE